MVNTSFLRILLYDLNYTNDINAFTGFSALDVIEFCSGYDASDLVNIKAAVLWATENKEFDFLSIESDLKFSNEELYIYICKINKSFHTVFALFWFWIKTVGRSK